MGIRSFGWYEAKWPKGTPIDRDWLMRGEPEEEGDALGVWRDFSDIGPGDLLYDLVMMFGRPLMEVEGLDLHCEYQCDEDERFECHLDILDGRATYEESVVTFERRPMGECPIGIG